MNKLALYDQVALTRDLNQHDLKRGDVATLVDKVPHPAGGPEGKSVVVNADDIEPLHADGVLAIRTRI